MIILYTSLVGHQLLEDVIGGRHPSLKYHTWFPLWMIYHSVDYGNNEKTALSLIQFRPVFNNFHIKHLVYKYITQYSYMPYCKVITFINDILASNSNILEQLMSNLPFITLIRQIRLQIYRWQLCTFIARDLKSNT